MKVNGVQRASELFQVVRGNAYERKKAEELAGHLLLPGSASIDVFRQASETEAGYIVDFGQTPKRKSCWLAD